MKLVHHSRQALSELDIGGSKSESNRWLILQKLYPELRFIHNLSDAQDTYLLKQALKDNISTEVNIHHAGTAMRFLTAYYALRGNRDVVLTGSERMKQRPIKSLVTALNNAGAEIQYLEKEGFPPIRISAKRKEFTEVEIEADISSQYISALMLIAPSLPEGLKISFKTTMTSKPYIEMTKKQLESIGAEVEWLEDGIKVYPLQEVFHKEVTVESDWSSASYWYSIAALSDMSDIALRTFKRNSIQGDSKVALIFEENFGVITYWDRDTIKLRKDYNYIPKDYIELDLNETPDIAQTIAVTCAGLQMRAKLKGLHTLKIKETDRLQALHNELKKCGVQSVIDDDSIEITGYEMMFQTPIIETYNDHRMAMSFAPLAMTREIEINNPEVVEKSYPNFWKDLEQVGFNVLP